MSAMNQWECQHPGCERVAYGCGGAVGLRAIGWHFQRGPVIFCPEHRPDSILCHDGFSESNHGKPCSLCAGEQEAAIWQAMMTRAAEGLARLALDAYRRMS